MHCQMWIPAHGPGDPQGYVIYYLDTAFPISHKRPHRTTTIPSVLMSDWVMPFVMKSK